MQFTLPWTPHWPERHTWIRTSAFLLPPSPSTFSLPHQLRGCFWANTHQSTVMGNGTPQPYWNNILRCVRISTQKSFRNSPIPSHMLGATGMFVFLYHFGIFFDSLHHTPICSINKGSLMSALMLCRESEKRTSHFKWEVVNYAGDRLPLMGLYWNL